MHSHSSAQDTNPINHTATVAKNTSVLIVGQVIVQASAVLIGILIARLLGQDRYGEYSLAFAFVGMFGLLFSLSTDSITIREIARTPEKAWSFVSAGLLLRLICFPLTIAVIVTGAMLTGYSTNQIVIFLLVALILGFSTLADLARAVFQGLQRMPFDTLGRTVEKGTALLFVAITVILFRSLSAALLAMLAGALIGTATSWALLSRLIGRANVKLNLRSSLSLLRVSLPLSGSMFVVAFYLQFPTVILSQFVKIGEVGLYNAANGVVSPFLLVPVAFGTALLPMLAARNSTYRGHYIMVGGALVIGLAIALAINFTGHLLLQSLFGADFLAARSFLGWLAFLAPLIFVNTYLTNFLIAHNQQHVLPFAAVANLILTVMLCYGTIPQYGVFGAVLARLVGEMGNMIILFSAVARRLKSQSRSQPDSPIAQYPIVGQS